MISVASAISEIKTIEEINHLFKIEHDYTLTKDAYRRPLRPYELINPDAKCQFLKKNKTCGQQHQHGFVVETCDNKKVLIGHCCALNHLGLNDEKVRNDFKRLSATERDEIRRSKIDVLLAKKETLTRDVKQILGEVKLLQSDASQVLASLPTQLVKTLSDRWKRNTLKVSCEYLIIKREKDKSGRTDVEKSWHPHECETLKGLGTWLQVENQNYAQRLYEFLHKLQNISLKKRLTKDELATAESVFNELAELDVLEREIKKQRSLIIEFCTLPNLLVTVQLFANRELRAAIVESAYHLSGESLKVSSSRVVDAIDRSIREHYKADGLRIAP
ncbi:hypothetical protein [Pseudomonas pharyngis]|uniref:hypothetical protein n=1 Tax=Pseudomonas pharyngis TaxID=2892333 RepID=UPI001F2BA015|nr:hypothetical protein [Pseudomonas pharyngis]